MMAKLYDGPIVDAHHHLWDLSMGKHPWLTPSDSAVPLPGLENLMHNYLVADYLRDSASHDVVATVHIEALWDAADPVGETRWLEALDKSSSVAARYIAGAALGTPAAASLIAAQAAYDRVIGVRGILSFHPHAPAKSFVSRPDLAYDADWRRDVGLVDDAGLHLELMMYPYQADAVFDLAGAFPDLRLVINHCGSPIDRDEAGMQRWRDGLKRIAERPNVLLKISNPGAYDPEWTFESVEGVVLDCIAAFGPQRCMFGTDYPVARLQMNFSDIYDNFKRSVAHLPSADQRALFHDNAVRVYRL
ncbi:amidohydrolase family protein [Phyllobacterium sp. 0TCS1.6C]|uniref:amidohydrolase family protein n=1 Tax=unclassified Phyllobacterium TaxID=2638441 RepID=UPI002263BA95|nr:MULTISPECIES: amidohydrolase family protein [unclassified Phyllobacterium]MCX8278962.1 amidohydrolase family protein [Phyllobacterium sp. 0TCS1.6C]MCX8293746.1 amidohydrolase family protein [Phyllobacterium sp. 0TCS1.6A]